jgi:anti-sigma B factor antagonist
MSQLNIRDNGNVVVVDFNHAKLLDDGTLREIGQEFQRLPLEAAAARRLLLNFANVEYMSSMMIGHIVRLNKQCKADKIRLMLCTISPNIMEVFTITRLNKILEIAKDEQSAVEAFGKSSGGWFGSG